MIYILLSLLICHFLADYCLTTHGMIAAKAKGWPLLPIVGHAAVHAILMGAALAVMGISWKMCLWLAALQLVTHFVISKYLILYSDLKSVPYSISLLIGTYIS